MNVFSIPSLRFTDFIFYRHLQICFRSNIRTTATATTNNRIRNKIQLNWFGFSFACSWISVHYHAHIAHAIRILEKNICIFFQLILSKIKVIKAHTLPLCSLYFVVGVFQQKKTVFISFDWAGKCHYLLFFSITVSLSALYELLTHTHTLARTESCALRTTVNYCQIHMLFHGAHTDNKILMKDKHGIGKCLTSRRECVMCVDKFTTVMPSTVWKIKWMKIEKEKVMPLGAIQIHVCNYLSFFAVM